MFPLNIIDVRFETEVVKHLEQQIVPEKHIRVMICTNIVGRANFEQDNE